MKLFSKHNFLAVSYLSLFLSMSLKLSAETLTTYTSYYNEKGEVTNFVCRSLNVSWEYDQLGNRIRSIKPNITNYYTVNALNQYTTISNSFGASVNLQYNEDGNLVKDHRLNYAWDAENCLVSTWPAVFQNGGIIVKNSYDHLHRRAKKEVEQLVDFDSSQLSSPTNGRFINIYTSTYVYDQNKLILEQCTYSNGTHSITYYVWGSDLSGTLDGAGGVGGLQAVQNKNGIFYPHYDANGNITEYVDPNGSVVAQYRYDPFGEIIYSSGSLKDSFHFRFSTKYHDEETFLYDYGNRFYDPWLGRWISRDPIEERGGDNLYGFLNNDAMNKIDPYGFMEGSVHVVGPREVGYHESSTLYGGVFPSFLENSCGCSCNKNTGKYELTCELDIGYYISIATKVSSVWDEAPRGYPSIPTPPNWDSLIYRQKKQHILEHERKHVQAYRIWHEKRKGRIEVFESLQYPKKAGCDKRTQPDVWESTPFIPKAMVDADYAQLDLETACILRFSNKDIGYIYFKKADKWHAQYNSSFMSITNNSIIYQKTFTNRLVQLGKEAPTVLCGNFPIRWGPPTTVFFSDEMSHAALIPIELIKSIKPDFTNSLSWVGVDVPPL
ncbi:MAG: RHS repeat-associated core domain-containing protein [Kiritimatiellia bacterium]